MSTLDTSALEHLVAQVVDRASEVFDGDCFVRTAAVILEIDIGPSTQLLTVCSDDRAWSQIAFLDEALHRLERKRDTMECGGGPES